MQACPPFQHDRSIAPPMLTDTSELLHFPSKVEVFKNSRSLPWRGTFCTILVHSKTWPNELVNALSGWGISRSVQTVHFLSGLVCRDSLVSKNTICEVLEAVVKFSGQ